MCLFFSDKNIVLFEKGSKQIKGPHHYEGQASSTRKKSLSHFSSKLQTPNTINTMVISAYSDRTAASPTPQ
jgi:hypothetical protein